MAILNDFKARLKPKHGEAEVTEPEPVVNKETGTMTKDDREDSSDAIPEIGAKYQTGVARVEAITSIWSTKEMVAAYIIIWLIYFITSLQEVVVRAVSPFVTSEFQAHSLTAATTIMSSLFGGLSKLVIAKLLDTWGRPQGMTVSMICWMLGFVMMAACKNVETYAAAQVFSMIGAQGVSYCLTIFIADTSSLVNRPLMLAFATSPYIVTPWIGGPMSDSVVNQISWRWGFGLWAIVIPVVVSPLIILFWVNQIKAEKQGLIEKRKIDWSPRVLIKSIFNWIVQVDLFGILILAAGMALFLLALSIYSFQKERWESPLIISFIVIGPILIFAFVAWERWFAPVTFIPYSLLLDRTVFFAGLMFVFVFFNSAVWGSFFTSMLMVTWNTGVTKATYISNIYRCVSCFAGLVIGWVMRKTARFKWVNAYYGLPLMMLGVGLMIQFRRPGQDIGYVVMTQIFVAAAGGPIVLGGEMAMLVPSDHQHVAVMIAILDLFGSIGTAVGSAVASAIWTGTFEDRLKARLPAGVDAGPIYSSLYTQLGYPVGTPIRDGIALAYGDSQRYMLIASISVLSLGWICTWFWRDIKVNHLKQVRGNVV